MNTFKSILVDVDATATAQPALERAVTIARKSGAPVRIVDVTSAMAQAHRPLPADLAEERSARRRERLAGLAHRFRDVIATTDVLPGTPAEALIEDVEAFGHDLLVRSHARDVAARGPRPFGPVDVQLFRRCPCPVWAVGAGAPPAHPLVAAAVDVSALDAATQALNHEIIRLALLLAHLQDGSLILMHAWQPVADRLVADHASDDDDAAHLDGSRPRLTQELGVLSDAFGSQLAGVPWELRRGPVSEALPELVVAEGVDLVVMGTMGRTGIARRLLGNTVERLLDRLPCSVVAVKPALRAAGDYAEERATSGTSS